MPTLLIANRGEIAVRILRSARALGWRTVAVYSEADRDALHVQLADTARCIGPAAASASYLNAEAVLAAAERTGATAIHPGYGFLSENAAFAEACAARGIRFVGPPAEAIRIMGAKDRARAAMQAAGVPVVPGVQGEIITRDSKAAAAEVGFPLLLKAAAGGGGKGMRVVRGASELQGAMAAVRREALAAFGDDNLLMERWVERPRHVEVQVFADAHGNIVHLFDRDCSTQRRHQKVIEEAPAPGLPNSLRERMAAAAIEAARAVDYVGAGTVEFLVAGDDFYFLEMNTRLQVEHPVTECVTGEDLVAWQLRVVMGEALPCTQAELRAVGHAVEARLYAEDPAAGFLPAIGQLQRLAFPFPLEGVRVDSGVQQGDQVMPHYDPMIAKVVAYGADRAQAFARLHGALTATRVHGVRTNLGLLRRLACAPALLAGPVHTTWLESSVEDLLAQEQEPPIPPEVARAAVARALSLQQRGRDAGSLFEHCSGLRLNAAVGIKVQLGWGELEWRLLVATDGPDDYRVTGPEFGSQALWARLQGNDLVVEQAGAREQFELILQADAADPVMTLLGAVPDRTWQLRDVLAPALARDEAVAGSLLAPMPGQVISVAVQLGDSVQEGDLLLVLEAMKMEHSIRAPHAGQVTQLDYRVGDRVEEGVVLVALEQSDD